METSVPTTSAAAGTGALAQDEGTRGEAAAAPGGRGGAEEGVPKAVVEPGWTLAYKGFSNDDDSRIFFSLPEDEQLQDEFLCALGPSNKRILLQGRMYIFKAHVCFHANIFGYVKKKVLRLSDVVVVKKACTAFIVPNALEIRTNRGKKIFFQSFLQRDVAYDTIVAQWRKSSGYAKLYLGHDNDAEGALGREAGPGGEGEGGPSSSDPGQFKEAGSLPDFQSDLDESLRARRSLSLTGGSTSDSDAEVCVKVLPESPGSMWGIMVRKANRGAAPALPRGMSNISGVKTIHCDLATYVEKTLSNASDFTLSYHTVRQDTDVAVSKWKDYNPFGYARIVSFRSPVRSNFGPATTRIQEAQRCQLFDGGRHLVLEASQQMLDIPYGDYFRIDTRFDIVEAPITDGGHVDVEHGPFSGSDSPARPTGESPEGEDLRLANPPAETSNGPTCIRITVSVEVVFEKTTMFKSVIEQGVMYETKESYDLMLRLAAKQTAGDVSWVPERFAVCPQVPSEVGREPVEETDSPSISIEEIQGKIPPRYRNTIMNMLGSEDSQADQFRRNPSSDDNSPLAQAQPSLEGDFQSGNGGLRTRLRRPGHRRTNSGGRGITSRAHFSQRFWPGLRRRDETEMVRASNALGKSIRAFFSGLVGKSRRKIIKPTGKDLLLVALVFLLVSSAAREFFLQTRISKLEEELGHLRRVSPS